MTVPVPDQLEYISDADGVTKDFAYPKRFLQKDEVVVALRNADGVDTPQVLNTHYVIAGSSWPTGGTISFVTAPQAPNKVVRYRMTEAKQTVVLNNLTRNDAPSVETQLDRTIMAVQDTRGQATKALSGLGSERAERIAADTTLGNSIIAEASTRANAISAIEDRQIIAGNGLIGGGTHAANVTLALSSTSLASLALANSAVQPTRTFSAGVGLSGGGGFDADRIISLSAASQASLVKADSAVQTINGKSGTSVTLNAGDVNAVPSIKTADIDANTAFRHSHSNKAILDAVTAAFTTILKTKLDGIPADADKTPTLAAVATSGNYDDLENKPSIPAAQVQTDWNAPSGIASIANKPTLGALAAKSSVAVADISATGTPSTATFLRGDNAWATPPGGGGSGGQVNDIIAGDGISVNSDDPANPVVSLDTATRAAINANTTDRHTHSNKSVLDQVTAAFTTAEKAKLAGVATGATANTGTVTSVAVSVPTGLSVANSPVTTSGTIAITYAAGYQGFTTAESSKLSGIATGATANQTDAYLLNRANHTGTQAISTVDGLQPALDARVLSGEGVELVDTLAFASGNVANPYMRAPNGSGGYKFSFLAPKSYVDDAVASKVDKSGGTLSGGLTLPWVTVTDEDQPLYDNNLAPKKYVDQAVAAIPSWPGVYAGTEARELNFPIGHPILVVSGSVNLNQTLTPRVATSGPTPPSYTTSSGDALSGIWRARGGVPSSITGVLAQRVG